MDWMQWDDIKANYYVDRDYLKKIGVEALPAVPYQQVADTINKGVFNPVVYRPLFECLGMVTCRTFETPAAGTIPLFLLDRDYVTEIFGERAIELVLDGEHTHEKIARRARAAGALRRNRHGNPEGFCPPPQPRGASARVAQVHRGVAVGTREISTIVTRQTSILDAPAGAQRMKLRYGFNEIDGWAAFSMGEHRAQIRRRLRLMGTQGHPRLCVRQAGA